jgi:chromosome segregation ATPase
MNSIDGLNLSSEQSRCSVPTALVLFDNTTLPACMDQELRTTMNATFEKKWNANSAQFQRTLAELSARFEAAQVELAATKDEYSRYKSRAQTVLAHQQTELASASSALESARAFEGEVSSLRAQMAELERDKADYHPHRFAALQSQLTAAQEQLAAQRRVQDEIAERYGRQITELETQVAEARTVSREEIAKRDEAHQAALRAAKEDMEKHRAKARELVTQKEAQIHALQSKMKLGGGGGSNSNLLDAPSKEDAPSTAPTASISIALAPAPTPTDAPSSVSFNPLVATPTASAAPLAAVDFTPEGQYQLTALLASRDEELNRCRAHIRQLQEHLRTAEIKSASTRDREADLQRRIGELDRMAQRHQEMMKQENVEYLKNVLVKYMTTGDEVRQTHVRTSCHACVRRRTPMVPCTLMCSFLSSCARRFSVSCSRSSASSRPSCD